MMNLVVLGGEWIYVVMWTKNREKSTVELNVFTDLTSTGTDLLSIFSGLFYADEILRHIKGLMNVSGSFHSCIYNT